MLYGSVLPVNTSPQAAVVFAGALIVGNAAGATVIVLDTDASGLPHASVAVHVSVTTPPQLPAGTCALKVDTFEVPLSSQYPVRPLLYGIVLPVNTSPQAAVVFPGAVIVGNAAGATVIVLDTDASGLPHASVAVHVSVTTPPQLPAGTCALKVDTFEVPLSSQYPVRPLLYGIVLPVNTSPQAAVVFPGAVIVGNAAGATKL